MSDYLCFDLSKQLHQLGWQFPSAGFWWVTYVGSPIFLTYPPLIGDASKVCDAPSTDDLLEFIPPVYAQIRKYDGYYVIKGARAPVSFKSPKLIEAVAKMLVHLTNKGIVKPSA